MAKWGEGTTVRDNQRRMVANTLRAGNKLTAAQKKNFSAEQITAIRAELKKESPHVKSMRMASGVASRNKKGGGQRLRKTFGTKSVYSGKTTGSPQRGRSPTGLLKKSAGTGKGTAAVAAYKKKKAADTRQRKINKAREHLS